MPLLSICIPTYNRAPHLENTLKSIVSQKIFSETDLIEIVIANNRSTDSTHEVASKYVSAASGKIRYVLNNVEIAENSFPGDRNAIHVLKKGSGTFLKLQNDNLGFIPGALDYMVDLINKTQNQKPIIFFKNHGDQNQRIVQTIGIDQFILEASYWTGWFGGFGIWKEKLELIPDFGRLFDQQIFTTDEYLRMVAQEKNALVIRTKLFAGTNVGKKGGFSLSKVYGTNYVNLLKDYLIKGLLRDDTLAQEKKNVFENHIKPYFLSQEHNFKMYGFFNEMSNYWDEPYFQRVMDDALLSYNPKLREIQSHRIETEDLKAESQRPNPTTPGEKWRIHNQHNMTYLSNVREPQKVRVGKYSYGQLNVFSWNNDEEFLEIGNFVSIADNVEFLLGGNHKSHLITNYPMRAIFMRTQHNEALTKGKITLQDDVWIGHGATILSGVSIGQGAIVAAKSVVTKNIQPYSIVAGNPAKVIGFRFGEDIVKELKSIDFSKLTKEKIIENLSLFETEPNRDSILAIKGILNDNL